MTDSSMFTGSQASDPATPPAVLAQIVQDRPDLRAAVAGNPSAYPALVEWLGALGDPEIDAAIASRGAAAPTPPPAAPTPPPAAPTPPPAAPTPPPPMAAPSPQVIQAPGGAAYPPQPGYAPVAPASGKKGLGAGAIVAIVAGALILVGGLLVGAFFLIQSLFATSDPNSYGDDATLDALWDACDGGDMAACDQLWKDAPIDSEYEAFGDTCGGLQQAGTGAMCVDMWGASEPYSYGDDATLDGMWDACAEGDMQACDDLYAASALDSAYESFGDTCGGLQEEHSGVSCVDLASGGSGGSSVGTYGDDAGLDALWDACQAGDMVSCDELYSRSPDGSDYEVFGDTCGWRQAEGTGMPCTALEGVATTTGGATYGDDSALDALWDVCAAGDMAACDELYMLAPVGSEYENFGDTCGYRQEPGVSFCDS